MSLKLGPHELGSLVNRTHRIWNVTDTESVISLNKPGKPWSGPPMDDKLLSDIEEIVRYDTTSRNADDQLQQQRLFIKLYGNVQSNEYYIGYAHWMRFMTTRMKYNHEPLHPLLDYLMKVPKQPEYGGKLWKTLYKADVNAKPAKELKRFALKEKLSKDKNEKDATWQKPVWPKPASQL